MKYPWRYALVAIAACAVSRVAIPCSVTHVANAQEITTLADAIILAEVVKYSKTSKYGGDVTFSVLEVLKGAVSTKELILGGQADTYDGPNDHAPPYNFVRRGGRHGNCFAGDYKIGGKFLLFMQNGSATWAPLAATNEEVSGPTDPWVWWVKGYLAANSKTAGDASGGE